MQWGSQALKCSVADRSWEQEMTLHWQMITVLRSNGKAKGRYCAQGQHKDTANINAKLPMQTLLSKHGVIRYPTNLVGYKLRGP